MKPVNFSMKGTAMYALNKLVATPNDPLLTILRLTLGVIFFAHGAQQILGLFGGYSFSETMNSFTTAMHIPAPLAFAPGVTPLENKFPMRNRSHPLHVSIRCGENASGESACSAPARPASMSFNPLRRGCLRRIEPPTSSDQNQVCFNRVRYVNRIFFSAMPERHTGGDGKITPSGSRRMA